MSVIMLVMTLLYAVMSWSLPQNISCKNTLCITGQQAATYRVHEYKVNRTLRRR